MTDVINTVNKIIYTNIIPSIKGDKGRKTVIMLLEDNNKLHYLLYGESISEDTVIKLERTTCEFPYLSETKANLNINLIQKDDKSILKLICLDTIENKKPMTIKEIEEKLGYNITIVG